MTMFVIAISLLNWTRHEEQGLVNLIWNAFIVQADYGASLPAFLS